VNFGKSRIGKDPIREKGSGPADHRRSWTVDLTPSRVRGIGRVRVDSHPNTRYAKPRFDPSRPSRRDAWREVSVSLTRNSRSPSSQKDHSIDRRRDPDHSSRKRISGNQKSRIRETEVSQPPKSQNAKSQFAREEIRTVGLRESVVTA
jgi:hypothetical protein